MVKLADRQYSLLDLLLVENSWLRQNWQYPGFVSLGWHWGEVSLSSVIFRESP